MRHAELHPWSLCALALLLPAVALAQEPVAAEQAEPAPTPDAPPSLEQRLATVEGKYATVEAELAAMRAEQAANALAEQPWTEDGIIEEFEPTLDVHGFFDLTFSYNDIPQGSPMRIYVNPYSTFLMSNVNLFVDAKPTETLSTTVELAFSFMPSGLYRYPAYYTEDGTRLADPVRDEPWARDNLTTAIYYPGNVRIGRAQAAWQPRDWFGVSAGKFLTPYGIWNVDHAPTVVLPIHVPYMQVRQMMPLEQLGLQVFGRAFVGKKMYLDYALTLSNGRTDIIPTDIGDLDNNKALGLGLGLSYDAAGILLKVGGYAYYGKLSDAEPRATVTSHGGLTGAEVERMSSYHELIASGYLLAELKGLRFQTELIWTRGMVIEPQEAYTMDRTLLVGDNTRNRYFQASWIGLGAYGMLAYTLPIRRLDPVRIIPFVLVEYNETRDTQPYFNQQYIAGGINLRPQSDLAIKIEYSRFFLDEKVYKGDLSLYAAQIAVSY